MTPGDASSSADVLTGYTASIADLTLPAVTYSHIDQTTAGTLTLTAEDNQVDPGASWHVTVLSSEFVYSGPHSGTAIPATNFRVTSAGAPIAISGQLLIQSTARRCQAIYRSLQPSIRRAQSSVLTLVMDRAPIRRHLTWH